MYQRGVTGLGKIRKIYKFFLTPPNADIVDDGVHNDVNHNDNDKISHGASDNMCTMISCS